VSEALLSQSLSMSARPQSSFTFLEGFAQGIFFEHFEGFQGEVIRANRTGSYGRTRCFKTVVERARCSQQLGVNVDVVALGDFADASHREPAGSGDR